MDGKETHNRRKWNLVEERNGMHISQTNNAKRMAPTSQCLISSSHIHINQEGANTTSNHQFYHTMELVASGTQHLIQARNQTSNQTNPTQKEKLNQRHYQEHREQGQVKNAIILGHAQTLKTKYLIAFGSFLLKTFHAKPLPSLPVL